MREIKKYKGIIKNEEKDNIDRELYKPKITPKEYYTIYGCSDYYED